MTVSAEWWVRTRERMAYKCLTSGLGVGKAPGFRNPRGFFSTHLPSSHFLRVRKQTTWKRIIESMILLRESWVRFFVSWRPREMPCGMNVPAECRGRLGKSQGWDWTGVGKPSERGGGHVTYDVEDLEAVGLVVEEPVLQVGASFSQAHLGEPTHLI